MRDGYLPDDWQRDAGRRELIAAVHVQAEIDHAIDPVEETAWLAALAAAHSDALPPMVCVAYADLRAPQLDDVLARHREAGPVRGIRQEAWFDPASTRADLPRVNMLSDPAWRTGLARLPLHELAFDLLVWPHQLAQAAAIFAALPDLTVVVEHTGLPQPGERERQRLWRAGLRRFAELVPRSVLKISALAFISEHWTVGAIRPVVLEAIEIFGAHRCMLGSNFPVDRGAASYDAIWTAYEEIVRDLSAEEQAALFAGTALQTYRIEES
jgi:predicted TIM-barrel fold metal-dependent hydrolase